MLRDRFFRRVLKISNYREGMVLSWWLLSIKSILYPVRCFYFYMHKHTGYQWETDIWKIGDLEYTDSFFRNICEGGSGVYDIKIIDGRVVTYKVQKNRG